MFGLGVQELAIIGLVGVILVGGLFYIVRAAGKKA